MTEDLIECYRLSKKLMPLLHLPVQSGSNNILKLMNRKHTVNDYLSVYEKLKKINKGIEFSSDFIIGYPGESEQDFNNTVKLIKKINFINSYSFIYSSRPGTAAENLQVIDKKISEKRLKIVQNILFQNQINRHKSLEGEIVNVLVENKMKDKIKLFGRTEFMTPVIFNGSIKNIGKIIQVKIKSSNQNSLFGKLIENYDQKVA
jgi:tRNA-2-methylthio-N6-dimethylallyladenosine synthase